MKISAIPSSRILAQATEGQNLGADRKLGTTVSATGARGISVSVQAGGVADSTAAKYAMGFSGVAKNAGVLTLDSGAAQSLGRRSASDQFHQYKVQVHAGETGAEIAQAFKALISASHEKHYHLAGESDGRSVGDMQATASGSTLGFETMDMPDLLPPPA